MTKKYLITGFSGFVALHFLEYLDQVGEPCQILGIDINEPEFSIKKFLHIECRFLKINLLDKSQVDKTLFEFHPDYILHLASYSSVAYSWKNPVSSFANNTNIFLNLLEQVRIMGLKCRILSVGSSEEYGNVSPDKMPLTEAHLLKPLSPYAVARVSQEMLSKVYVDGFGLDIILTRSFNHIGPGQKDLFVVSSFAKQLVEIKKNKGAARIMTGDLSIIRDFLDVRDVVKAYYLLFNNGRKGEVYNVCSGQGISLNEIVDIMAEKLEMRIEKVVDASLIRPSDNKIIIGDNQKIVAETGWACSYGINRSLADIIEYWEHHI